MTQPARHENNRSLGETQARETEKVELRKRLLEMIKQKEALRREKPR